MNSGVKVDWEKYSTDYADFINRHDVKYFFEIDLDTIIGVKETQKITKRLESLTGKQCIPVFHRCRGIDAYKKMCRQYDYVAIGASGITEECRWVKNDSVLKKWCLLLTSMGAKFTDLAIQGCQTLTTQKYRSTALTAPLALAVGDLQRFISLRGADL